MFTTISWGTFFTGITLSCLAWYLYVGLRYYRQEISIFFTNRKKNPLSDPPVVEVDNFFIEPVIPLAKDNGLEDNFFQDIDHLIGRIKKVFNEASEKNADINELTGYLKLLLKEYPEVKDSVFRSQINEIITAEHSAGHYLTEEEADRLW
ncbi:MAG: hypothetical protein ACLGH8_15010 [Bacteroidia bacterium]